MVVDGRSEAPPGVDRWVFAVAGNVAGGAGGSQVAWVDRCAALAAGDDVVYACGSDGADGRVADLAEVVGTGEGFFADPHPACAFGGMFTHRSSPAGNADDHRPGEAAVVD